MLAGNIHLGAPLRRLSETLLPVWRYAAVTAPLGERLAEAITFQGSVTDTDGIDHFRIVDGDRLMWASSGNHLGGAAASVLRRRHCAPDPHDFSPARARSRYAEVWGGAVGQTVHGMPQIGQLRRGLWVTSGFGRQGLNTSAMAGQLIARSILWGDERWRLFSPFELVWAGGPTGRVAGHVVGHLGAGKFGCRRRAGPLPGTGAGPGTRSRGASGRGQPPGRNPAAATPPPSRRAGRVPSVRRPAGRRDRDPGQSRADRRTGAIRRYSQESEKFPPGPV